MAQAVATSPRFSCMLVDLDDTLYRVPEFPRLVRDNIQEYMKTELGIAEAQIGELNQELYVTYGTTMAGLAARGYKIDFDDWHEKVHLTLPYADMLHTDPALRSILASIRLPKYVLTNADLRHAKICLERLGIQDLFQGVIAFENLNEAAAARGLLTAEHPVLCKPARGAYELALQMIGADLATTAFFDDSVRNTRSAHAMGMFSVLVGTAGSSEGGHAGVAGGADLAIPDMHHLPAALPELFGGARDAHELEPEHAVAISVTA